MPDEVAVTDHFGACPICGSDDGYINAGKGHWFRCDTHRIKWFVGSNLFASWRDETESEQRARYDELSFGSYRDVTAQTTGEVFAWSAS